MKLSDAFAEFGVQIPAPNPRFANGLRLDRAADWRSTPSGEEGES
jgi:hypothetical protein